MLNALRWNGLYEYIGVVGCLQLIKQNLHQGTVNHLFLPVWYAVKKCMIKKMCYIISFITCVVCLPAMSIRSKTSGHGR